MDNKLFKKLDEIKNLIVTNGNIKDKWLDMNQASQYCSCSISTIRRNIDSGSLKSSTRLGKRLFLKSHLDEWLNN